MSLESEELVGRSGTYTITTRRPFAYGRLSVLYEATAPDGELVCVKLFKSVPDDEDARSGKPRFLRELEAQRRLTHPNILPVLDFGTSGEGAEPFVIYPLCKGGNLRELIRERSYVPVSESLAILGQIAAAIDFAHNQGFIHGDVKPESRSWSFANLLFYRRILRGPNGVPPQPPNGGLSRVHNSGDKVSTRYPNEGAGTTAYLSPEQLADGKQSRCSDVYSFGIVAYELLTGRLPFDSSAPLYRQIEARVKGALVDPGDAHPDLPSEAIEALKAALSVDPTHRPTTTLEFCRMLSGHEAKPRSTSGSGRLSRQGTWASLDAKAKAGIIGAVIAAVGGVITALIKLVPELIK
ncbi:MAG: serine/threonine protein kinase [Acidobacteria bacterium]|nr:serine/threonine protein kinase [Acidobacteriota bacterium]